jgi:hypothetical protein
MITSQEYIRKELDAFINVFSSARVRYEYDANAQTHFVEIVPNEIYRLRNDYILWESEMFDKFIALYPTENICFITDDALVGIEHTEYTLYGKNYTQTTTVQKAIRQPLRNKFPQPGSRKRSHQLAEA